MSRVELLVRQIKGVEMGAEGCSGGKKNSRLAEVEAKYTKKEFLELWGRLHGQLVEELEGLYGMPPHAREWVAKMLQHNVPGGKLNRGLTVVHTLLLLEEGAGPAQVERAGVLGWCVELLQAFFLVADDVMDSSVTRRGQPCWYLSDAPVQLRKGRAGPAEKVGLIAVNDSFLLEAAIYRLLRRYFRGDGRYGALLELFLETTYQTELGQLLDLTSQPQGAGNVDLAARTLGAYSKIVVYKTAFYSFYLPVALGLVLVGRDPVADRAAFDEALAILLPMGEFFQIQDDFLDCYGAPEVIGKVGRDIEEKKCGWLAVQCLQRCSPADRALFEANYGRDDPSSVAAVKALYGRLDLARVYHAFEEASYQELSSLIAKSSHVSKHVYQALLEKIYKRTI